MPSYHDTWWSEQRGRVTVGHCWTDTDKGCRYKYSHPSFHAVRAKLEQHHLMMHTESSFKPAFELVDPPKRGRSNDPPF